MNRRIFLKLGLNMAAFSVANRLVPTWVTAAAGELPQQFFIYIHFHSGWDTSLFSDPFLGDKRPEPSKYFVEYRQDELLKVGENFYGPALKPLQAFLPRLSVVNGIFMNSADVGHSSLATYMSTGGQAKGPAAWDIFEAISPSLLGVAINNLDLPQPHAAIPFDGIKSLSTGSLTDKETRGTVVVNKNQMENTLMSLGHQSTKFDRIKRELTRTTALTQNDDWANLAAAFLSGATSTAQISIDSQLDTHSGHIRNHLRTLTSDFESIADLLLVLQKTNLLDRTTIVIGSEFCRTPHLNGPLPTRETFSSPGKDHNPWSNSAIILGPGIKPGKIVGASRLVEPSSGKTYLSSVPITVDTEKPLLSDANTKIVRPTTLWHTVMVSMGIPNEKIPREFRGSGTLRSLLQV